ncbi:hypothetical protein F5Y10DRAFT_254740 [Nemania abortiva]|nr:hypothetical protein F5Y10DRAFT_254740 [Nemania abortiva]
MTMMLTSRTVPRSQPLQARTSTGTALVRFCHPTQIRTFRFGLWSSYLDPAYHRELRRRHRDLKHKYDSINRRLPWCDYEHASKESRFALKRAMLRLWWLNQDGLVGQKPSTPRSPHEPWHIDYDQFSKPPGRQAPPDTKPQHDMQARAEHLRTNDGTKQPKSQEAVSGETSSTVEKDYVIDPITNRRVPKRDQRPPEIGLDPLTRTFKTYRSQFAAFTPPALESERPEVLGDKPSASELDKYAKSNFDDWPATSTRASVDPADSSSHTESISHILDNSKLKNEEYALNHLPLEDPIEDYGNVHECQTAAPDERFKKPSDTSEHHNVHDRVVPPSPTHADLSHHAASRSDQLQSELRDYGPYMHDEDSPTDVESQDSQDLEQYRYRHRLEPEQSTETSTDYNDLHKYEPATFEDFEKKDQLFEQYGDLEKYKVFRLQHLDTPAPLEQDTVAEGLKEYEAKEQDAGAPNTDSTHYHHTPLKVHQNIATDQNATAKYPENPPSATNSEALQSTLHQPREVPRLEPALNRLASATKNNTLDRTFGADLFSKEPQGLETSFSEECGGKHTMPLYKTIYGSEPGQVSSASKPIAEGKAQELPERSSDLYYDRDPEIDGILQPESADPAQPQKATQPGEPTVYKILAYDPTMQTISIAETSSVVPDLASPLSPSEVLLRLSNPTKFFPHFAPLQAEGFEIASGSGDVLVFRQVRPAKPIVQGGAAHVNPIDLMGRSTAVPNAAAFVSPTGFVNYDMPRIEDEPAKRADQGIRSIRREEPVFSGQKSPPNHQKSKKPKMKAGKRVIIGGVWVAGLSYALGVVTEYFATGGTDGKGPTGFSPV